MDPYPFCCHWYNTWEVCRGFPKHVTALGLSAIAETIHNDFSIIGVLTLDTQKMNCQTCDEDGPPENVERDPGGIERFSKYEREKDGNLGSSFQTCWY